MVMKQVGGTNFKVFSIKNEIMAFKHHGFWHPMDTLRDKNH